MKKLVTMVAALLVTGLLATAEEAKSEYPLKTCVVSGDELGEMGDPVIYQHNGREVRFCCKDCIEDFNKDPEKYLKMLDDAAKEGAAAPEAGHEKHHHHHHDDAK